MADKYLSIVTNFGCHYSCPECIVRNNKLKMTPTEEYSSYMQLEHVLKNECNDCNWVSVSGGGDPLYHWWEHQAWWTGFFSVCKELGRKIELHTSYYDFDHDDGILMFPFERFDRVVYHLHCAEELYRICRRGKEIVRAVFVVDDSMDEYEVSKISVIVQESDDIDELTFRQYVDENYKETYHLHDLLLAGHKKAWWYVTQCDYNTYYHNGRLFKKYTDIFDKSNYMKQYLVSVWTRQSYTQWVEAESEEKAKMIAEREFDHRQSDPDDNEEIDATYVIDEEEIEDE